MTRLQLVISFHHQNNSYFSSKTGMSLILSIYHTLLNRLHSYGTITIPPLPLQHINLGSFDGNAKSMTATNRAAVESDTYLKDDVCQSCEAYEQI